MATDRVQLYDTTLRDGSQMEGISFTVAEKILITQKLDELGIEWIEGGFPGSNPRDAEFFRQLQNIRLKNAKVSAFGGTRKAGITCEDDPNIRSLTEAGTPGVTLVGKASRFQVEHILETTAEENLAMIADSVGYFKKLGKTVAFDAEHFFDGFFDDPDYSLQCLATAARAGADVLALCDTNGGMITSQLLRAVSSVQDRVRDVRLGIHCHDDAGLAVANTLAAVEAGVWQVQGCINGYGERCGNANILTVLANLKLKMGLNVVEEEQLARLSEISYAVSELANFVPNPQQPYVGASAFAHKAGYHAAGVIKDRRSYQHIDPELVGNHSRVLVSELSGQRNLVMKLEELDIDFPMNQDEIRRLLAVVKQKESQGFQYDGADASFELLVRRARPGYEPPWRFTYYHIRERRQVIEDGTDLATHESEATVKLSVGAAIEHTVGEGNGPVNALDQAVRKALAPHYPEIGCVNLVDYKVRILDSRSATGATVRVLIESSDGRGFWTTVGSSTDVIEASWLALQDALEYGLLRAQGARHEEVRSVKSEG